MLLPGSPAHVAGEKHRRTVNVKYGEGEVVLLHCDLLSFGRGRHIPNYTACSAPVSATQTATDKS